MRARTFDGTNELAMRTLNTILMVAGAIPAAAQWTSVSSGTISQLEAVHITNAQEIIAAGKDGVLVSSINGGTSWSALDANYGDDLNEIMRIDASTLLVFADGGAVVRSEDNGATWSPSATATPNELVSAERVGSLIIAVGEAGAIIRSEDTGASWATSTSGTFNDLQAVVAIDASTWMAVGKSGTVLRSTDGGVSWLGVGVSSTVDLNDIDFASAAAGVIVGDEGVLLRSSDSGSAWTSVASGTGTELDAAWSTDASTIYACGVGGVLLRSTNAGISWSSMTTPVITELRDISVSGNIGFAVGAAGTIIRLGAGSTDIEQVNSASVFTSGPNPSSGDVTLRSSFASPVCLEVRTADGRLVLHDTNASLIAGYRLFGLAAGMYKVRATDRDGQSAVRSLIVVR